MVHSAVNIGSSVASVDSATPIHAIGIVGAGPRGTSVLERLCASATEILAPGVRLTIHIIDPWPPGAGSVWRITQSSELLMNTVASQITLYTDESVECLGPKCLGPSMYEWARSVGLDLGPDKYPTRSQYGRYLEWVFGEVASRAPPEIEIVVHEARAVRLDNERDGRQTLTLSTGHILSGLAAVVLAQGHLPALPGPEQYLHTIYAQRYPNLRHIPSANPADVDLSSLGPGEPVLLRGLGLNFFDYMALLTTGRGGRFTRTSSGLRYCPSGNEPRLYAGSRRGVPYQARADNAKGPWGRHTPLVLTDKVIANFHRRADSGDAPDFLSEVWPLVAKEVETVYYEGVLEQDGSRRLDFRDKFLGTPHNSSREAQLLDDFGISKADRWSWDRISRPYGGRIFNTAGNWQDWLLTYLREDVKQAALGNVKGPLKAALDVMRDIRNELRLIVDHDGISGDSRRDHLDCWYTPLNAFLSIGPPRERIEQLIALMEAGIVDILGPRLEVITQDGAWLARSPDIPGSAVRVTTLIEARLPEPTVRSTADDLLVYLRKTGQCRPHSSDGYETGGLDITDSPFHLIDRRGCAQLRRYAIGVPTEGVHWVTAAGARPGVNSRTLSETDAVARAALHVAEADISKNDIALEHREHRLQHWSEPWVIVVPEMGWSLQEGSQVV
ncbi:FAD-NAD(P)-binding-domain-containing protein [Hypoxylon rubiginosum]|uniref:FAD-NAD(P)-binding-domain-containing protein n=1 Tax=Hypoxylon rubiginosum TaxID=110542 RepID=A0ACB9ZBU6_9PEZI|nr:FAD-NAD(P)-binding-domain-containing protein [Hypoxylon rubiginosum]